MQTVGIRDIRTNLAQIIERVSITGESVLVTKFGKPKVLITPVENVETSMRNRQEALDDVYGMWNNSVNAPTRENTRHEEIFN